MLYFFLSYAPDEDDIFVHRLFRDLSAEIARRIGAEPQQAVGYLDDSGGNSWPADARAALGTSQTFIALCSSRYLASDRCGRYWGAFIDRIRKDDSDSGEAADALIPVVWAADGVTDDLFSEPGLDIRPHRTPHGDDLRIMMRLRSHRAAYLAFVASLAHRVVETAHAHRLRPAPLGLDLDAVANPFEQRRQGAAADTTKVYVVVAAGTRDQMRAIRNDLQFYGRQREDWAPYQPVAPQSLAARACGIVSNRRLESEVVPIESVPERLRKGLHRDILVLLVDAWATHVDDLDRALREIGKQDDEAVAVLMPASQEDRETSARRVELRGQVLKSFPSRSSWHDSLFRIGVDSPDEFDADLSVAIAAAQRRAYRRGWRTQRADAPRSGAGRPVLEGP
jgi:FxsC-like protein